MSRRIPPLFRAAAAGFLLLAGGRLSAQLTTYSPFQPLPSSVPAAVTDSQLKYGGFIQTSEGKQYRVSDVTRKAAAFIKLNQRDEVLGVTVKQHDAEANTLTVEFQGRTMVLAEPKMKIVSSGGAPAPMPMPAGQPQIASNMLPAVTQSVVANPTAQDEQRRLDAVASEVARRRAMREQAGSAGIPGAPATAVPAQPIGVQPQR